MTLKIIEDKYSLALQTKIRSRNTDKEDLRGALIKLGQKIGVDIVSDNMLKETEVSTPMNQIFQGYSFCNSVNLVYSTKDDYEFFAKGISLAISNPMQGYFDFQGVRGLDALTQPVRAASHPPIKPGTIVDTVVIAKAVLATGCTAISLAKNIMSKFQPKNLIIASAFYSQIGIRELFAEIPNIKFIYTVGTADTLNEDGMLIPGVGNLDSRLLG
ncbi:uracil phosphoribosyltransferase [Metabacillus fastidiosus]|uniref:uracil phosphoribosyltransferase n=1 Tax=Metabacillus fastidiosus TaxID=1458 RepID=UPI002DBBB139|nr:uracil phosphoribosyltransferase [Metabacillus fastidiosus]MEC2077634.1 uracil phosphoribosyltransferase [Metabacillus fastidiosus]